MDSGKCNVRDFTVRQPPHHHMNTPKQNTNVCIINKDNVVIARYLREREGEKNRAKCITLYTHRYLRVVVGMCRGKSGKLCLVSHTHTYTICVKEKSKNKMCIDISFISVCEVHAHTDTHTHTHQNVRGKSTVEVFDFTGGLTWKKKWKDSMENKWKQFIQ